MNMISFFYYEKYSININFNDRNPHFIILKIIIYLGFRHYEIQKSLIYSSRTIFILIDKDIEIVKFNNFSL